MDQNSRLDKYEKRRKNTKFITYFAMAAAVLALFLIGTWIFGGGDEEKTADSQTQNTNEDDGYFLEIEEDDETDDESVVNNNDEENSDGNSEENTTDSEQANNEDEDEETSEIDMEETNPSDDNVKEAFTGNWPPSGTEQTGPHTTVYSNGSQDRIEIKQAVSDATGIASDDLIEWWVENGGDQKVIATVSDKAETETFRVYLSWIDNEGWQPTKIETLLKNDKKKN